MQINKITNNQTNIENLKRISVPKDLQKKLQISDESILDVNIENDRIIIKEHIS